MSEENLTGKAKDALRHIRNWIMHNGKVPSMRELMFVMEYKSPRSAALLIEELIENGFLDKKEDGSFKMIKDLDAEQTARTVTVPLVGSVACGGPLIAEQNIEALILVSTLLAKPGSKYFLLRANGDSMNSAGINDGDLVLVRQQPTAEDGQKVVALIDDEATVKEVRYGRDVVTLLPRSTNPAHQPIILTNDFQIQGIVIATIPKTNH